MTQEKNKMQNFKKYIYTKIKNLQKWIMENLLLAFLSGLLVTFSTAIVLIVYKLNFSKLLHDIGVEVSGGLIALIGIVLLYKRVQAIDDGNTQQRYIDAIKLLNSESFEIRLSGIYELFEIALKDYSRRPRIVKNLCSYIRTTTCNNKYQEENKYKPSVEIQSILNLLKDNRARKIFSGESKLDFSNTYLVGANFYEANLQGSDFRDANLQRAEFDKAQLQGTILSGAYLQKASLWKAQLRGAIIREAYLQRARLLDSHLQEASIASVYLQGANLEGVNLQRAHIWRSNLQGCYLRGAELQEADFSHCNLQGANFSHAELQGASLNHAELQGSSLSKASLQGANLRYAQLQATNLEEASLQGADLAEANLQEANLQNTNLQGSFCGNGKEVTAFKKFISNHIGKTTDLSKVIFSGGLDKKFLKNTMNNFSIIPWKEMEWTVPIETKDFREKMQDHIDKPAEYGIPKEVIEKNNINVGSYSKEEAKQWIREYNEALKGIDSE